MTEFYNVKLKKKVQVETSKVSRRAYEKISKNGKLTIRYSLKATGEDGTKLSKFCTKIDYDAIELL
tara:strand:+ start:107 stop:304 length:198 start_codon:yes stop_codon:yes gene_type:complete